MSEAYVWMVLSYLNIFGEMLLVGYLIFRLMKPFLQNSRGAWKIGAGYAGTMFFLYLVPVRINNFIAYSIGMCMVFVIAICLDRRNYYQKLFLVITGFALRWITVTMVGIVHDWVYAAVIENAYMVRHVKLQLAGYAALLILQTGLEYVIFMGAVHCILRAFVYKTDTMSAREMLMITVPSVLGMTGYGIIQCYENYYDISYGRKGIYSGLTLLHYGISFAAIVVVIVLYQRMQESHRQNLEKHVLQLQIEDMQKHISQVESLYGDIRALKHDMANHVMTLETLYAENEMQQVQSYAKHLKTALKDAVSEIKSGNPVTDVILAEYRKRAKQCGIRFENHFFYPENGALDVFDVSIILNNALDNALEAAQAYALSGKNAEVNICSYLKNHAYMIEVSNSFAGQLHFDAAGDLPQTQKRDAGSHGFGLANIRRIAWKYYGDIEVQAAQQQFQLVVMLMLENDVKG